MKKTWVMIRLAIIPLAFIASFAIISVVTGTSIFSIRGSAKSLSSLPMVGAYLEDTTCATNVDYKYDIVLETIMADSPLSKSSYREIARMQSMVIEPEHPCTTNELTRLMTNLRNCDRKATLRVSQHINEFIHTKSIDELLKQSSVCIIKAGVKGRRFAELFFIKLHDTSDGEEGLLVLYAY